MKTLHAASQSMERFNLLLSLTKISSCEITKGLEYNLVKGFDINNAALLSECRQPNLHGALSQIESVSKVVELIKEIDINPSSAVCIGKIKERFDLLLSLTKIASLSITKGLEYRIVKGFKISDSAMLSNCKKSNLQKALNKLEEVSKTIELIKELDFNHLTNINKVLK